MVSLGRAAGLEESFACLIRTNRSEKGKVEEGA